MTDKTNSGVDSEGGSGIHPASLARQVIHAVRTEHFGGSYSYSQSPNLVKAIHAVVRPMHTRYTFRFPRQTEREDSRICVRKWEFADGSTITVWPGNRLADIQITENFKWPEA